MEVKCSVRSASHSQDAMLQIRAADAQTGSPLIYDLDGVMSNFLGIPTPQHTGLMGLGM